ncbi:MAG: hypothetical protein L0332_20145 [Chloroflexi bacterium]|nr:hypothetical protein [Chloroflexota bacterium]MCI0647788.1 hypothetical protein [Chloroflexota bacterium]MCI0729010.1 hypothetical protein [Chloroflexota bacterium]
MPVIINEFEVVMEPSPPPPAQPAPMQPQSEATPVRPESIIRIQQRHQARIKRVWAD